ncbi:MAG: peptide deformylase [Weeksellaceae bacterium]
MSKFSLFLLCIGFFSISSAQKFEKFSKQEKELIQSQPTEMLRVYNLANPNDSLVLKSMSKPLKPRHKLTRLLAERMLLTVQNPEHTGVGIAAPQVGINRRIIVVQRFDKITAPFEVFVNPEIIWQSDLLQKGPEGDLSFERRTDILRNYTIEIRYQDLNGIVWTEVLEGFTAVIFQHERDHLDGVLLTDRRKEQEKGHFESSSNTLKLYFKKD